MGNPRSPFGQIAFPETLKTLEFKAPDSFEVESISVLLSLTFWGLSILCSVWQLSISGTQLDDARLQIMTNTEAGTDLKVVLFW